MILSLFYWDLDILQNWVILIQQKQKPQKATPIQVSLQWSQTASRYVWDLSEI